MRLTSTLLTCATVVVLGVVAVAARSDGDPTTADGAALVDVMVPEDLSPQARAGQAVFDAVCAQCHGANAAGREGFGPPLVHRIYEPSHHGDAAFLLAVQNGVRAHHWPYGNMPPQQGLTRADVIAIIIYVRTLQQANGIR